jgi:hypothetical protein
MLVASDSALRAASWFLSTAQLLAAALPRSSTEAEAVTHEVHVVTRLADPIAVAPPSELGAAVSDLRPIEQAMLILARRARSDPVASDINDVARAISGGRQRVISSSPR